MILTKTKCEINARLGLSAGLIGSILGKILELVYRDADASGDSLQPLKKLDDMDARVLAGTPR
jgi:hypothetical protein